MIWWHYLLIGVGTLFLLLIAIVLIRTALFKPKADVVRDDSECKVNEERAIKTLGEMVRCKTISYVDKSKEDAQEFERFGFLLPTLFPLDTST